MDFSGFLHGLCPANTIVNTFIMVGIVIIIGIVLFIFIYSKKLKPSELQNSSSFLQTVLNDLNADIIACDVNGKIILFNHVIEKEDKLKLDYATELAWDTYFDLYLPNGTTLITTENAPIFRALNGEHIQNLELIMVTKTGATHNVIIDGQPILKEDGTKLGAVIAIRDITERKKIEEQFIQQATHDTLTGLPNRSLLLDRINQAINQAKRSKRNIAVLFFDLDHFKLINDGFGHAEGDQLLLKVGQRLQSCLRDADTVARFGGDEFVAVITGMQHEENAALISQKILEVLAEPFSINELKIHITTSIGISVYPNNGETADVLLRNADTAMYLAKEHGRNNFKYYSNELNFRTLKRIELESHLKYAVEKNELFLMYQPIIDMHTGYIIGLEALVRWQHPMLGLIEPLDFISIAEENGLISEIGEWVLRTACKQNKTWQQMGLTAVRIAVNVSGRQFFDSEFVTIVQKILDETQLEPQYLELELTETHIIKHTEVIIKSLKALKQMGINIALDDFGTGYSSLSYLKRLPVDKLKIDKSFLQDITNDDEDAAMLMAVITMASNLKLKVLAEGMENEKQFGFLRLHRCNEIQGYYFSRPLTLEACTKLLQENPKLIKDTH